MHRLSLQSSLLLFHVEIEHQRTDRTAEEMKYFLLCLLISLTSCEKSDSDKGEITCTAPHVKKGDVGSVTCYFSHDVNTLLPVTVSVELYTTETSDTVVVLECNWITAVTAPCKLRDGYTFDGNVSNTLTMRIAEASDAYAGRYLCKLMAPSVQENSKACTLRLMEDDSLVPDSTASARLSLRTTATSKVTNSSHPRSDRQVANSNVVVIAAVVPIVVVIIAVAVVAVVVCYRKRICCFKKAPTDAEQSPEQNEEGFPLKTPSVSETDSDEDDTPESKNKDNTDPNTPESDPVKKGAGSDDHDDDNDDDDDEDDGDDDDVDVNKRGNTEASGDPIGDNP